MSPLKAKETDAGWNGSAGSDVAAMPTEDVTLDDAAVEVGGAGVGLMPDAVAHVVVGETPAVAEGAAAMGVAVVGLIGVRAAGSLVVALVVDVDVDA